MACRSCQRELLQACRSVPSFRTEAYNAATIATHLGRLPQASAQHQRRGFRTSSRRGEKSSIVPQSMRDAGAQLLRSAAQPYQVNRATEEIYNMCAKEATYAISEADKKNGTVPKTEDGEEIGVSKGPWHADFGLLPTFSTWAHVTMLHMYLVHARCRDMEREAAQSWQRQLADHYFFDAEERMDAIHGITSRALRQRYLKDIFEQWRGVIAAYDEGLVKGDAVLAAAVWRNLLKGRGDVDLRALAAIVSWMRLGAQTLDQIPDEALAFQATDALKRPARNELLFVDTPVKELEPFMSKFASSGQSTNEPLVKAAA